MPGLERDQRVRWYRRLVVSQVSLDWVAITAFVHFTGGVSSPAITLFLIHMVMVTALLQTRRPMSTPRWPPPPCAWWPRWKARASSRTTMSCPGIRACTATCASWPRPLAFFGIAAFASVHMINLVVVRLRERDRQVSALLLASQAASSSIEIEQVLDHLVESAARALSAKAAHLRLRAETGDHVDLGGVDRTVRALSRSRHHRPSAVA